MFTLWLEGQGVRVLQEKAFAPEHKDYLKKASQADEQSLCTQSRFFEPAALESAAFGMCY